jgi:hypothetical protein
LSEIKHRWTGKTLFSYAGSVREAVIEALRTGANLMGANLSYTNLSHADLRGANLIDANLGDADLSHADLSHANLGDAELSYADLRGADLSGADLSHANLSDADLSDADLSDANLSYANLRGANLSYANLRGANLSCANLSYANLRGANLSCANLSKIRYDFFSVLNATPGEVDGLRATLFSGKVNGSTYEGECACLVGTIAHVRGCNYEHIDGLKPNSTRPIERFFLAIRPGYTPENHQVAKVVAGWIDEWRALRA